MSIQKRFIFSVGANIARAAVSLLVGLLVARGLGPADYGNLAYLLGSFWAIRALLDMGASSAFYTFIAQKSRGRLYYLIYFGWLAFQFVFSVILVVVLLPSDLIDRFWLGQEREMILLALLATFLQNQVWQTIVQIHEAARKTIKVQIVGVLIIIAHLLLVLLMLFSGWLEIRGVLWAIVAEYLAAVMWLTVTLQRSADSLGAASFAGDETGLKSVFSDYLSYCRPMVLIAVATFFYEIADRWLLQRFGGASQQGFYQVASQLSTISLLATASILNIFWKEIAEACARGDRARVIALHNKTTRLLIFVASAVSCFLAPWTEQLVNVLLGNAYHAAWPILFVMLFYPIHQAMGQINGTLFLATRQNTIYMRITIAGLLVGIPVSYVLIAPMGGVLGLEMGAMGLAIKIVGLNILFVNIQSWVIARLYNTKFQWKYQVGIVLMLLSLGYFSRFAVERGIPGVAQWMSGSTKTAIFVGLALSGLVYLTLVITFVMRVPAIAGLDQTKVSALCDKIRAVYRRGKGFKA